MKKIKKLLVRNAVALLAPFVLCGCKTNNNQNEIAAQETINLEIQRENESMEAFYDIITDKEEITDGISSNQQTKFYNEKIQELWEYIDKKILSHTNYEILKNQGYYGSSTILMSDEFNGDRKFQFKSIECNKKSITFYQSKEFCSKVDLNRPYFEVGYNNDGSIYYAYQTNLSQNQKDHKDTDGKGVIIKYTPQNSILTITSRYHLPETSLRLARWNDDEVTTYNIASQNNISILNQLVRLYENNVTLAEIIDNIDQIVNATFLMPLEENTMVEEENTMVEEENTMVEEENTMVEEENVVVEEGIASVPEPKEKIPQILKEAIKSTVYSQDQKVEETKVEEIMSQLDFKSDLFKEIAPTAINSVLSNNNWGLTYKHSEFLGYYIDNANEFISLKTSMHEDWFHIAKNVDGDLIWFTYSNSQGVETYSLCRYNFTVVDNIVPANINIYYFPGQNVATMYLDDNEEIIEVDIPEEIRETFICQMANDYINMETSKEIADHILSFEQQNKTDNKVLVK